MCHQSIFSFVKCRHTAEALTICSEGNLRPVQRCLDTWWEGDFIQFDTVCAGCRAVFLLQGEKNGQCLPKGVKGIHETMPFEYVIGSQLPWSQPRYNAQKPPKVGMVVWSEWDSWKIWEEHLLSLILSQRDNAVGHMSSPSQEAPTSPSRADTPVSATQQEQTCSHEQSGKQRRDSPRRITPQFEAQHKSSIKRTDEQQLSPTQQTSSQPRPKHRVRFVPTAEVQFYMEDKATCHFKKGESQWHGIQDAKHSAVLREGGSAIMQDKVAAD